MGSALDRPSNLTRCEMIIITMTTIMMRASSLWLRLLLLFACFLSSAPTQAFAVVVTTTKTRATPTSLSTLSFSSPSPPPPRHRTITVGTRTTARTTTGTTARTTTTFLGASVSPGDTVLVVGGTSGVGQLVTQKLVKQGYPVKATCRNVAKGQEILGGGVQVVALDLVSGSQQQLQEALQGAAAVVISVGTTAFPTLKWKGGNTPEAIDKIAVTRIANALSTTAAAASRVKKVVLVTSVGVERTGEMPFVILNLFGVLDAKKAGEQAIIEAATTGFDYVIIRPGRLIGGPFTNLDVARLLQIEGGAENGVTVQVGDSLLGDCKRDACAEAIVQCLINDECKNVAFSIASNEEKALTRDQWKDVFQTLCDQ